MFVCLNLEGQIQDDWNNLKMNGYGMGKRQSQNQRIAQWIVSGQKFEGGVYQSIFTGEDYQDNKEKVVMMKWSVLCAAHGKEVVVDICACMVIMCVCVCVGV